MLKSNFHTHTYRCNHATGTEREYVEGAIQAGIKKLGFSDHVPYGFKDGYYSDFRMRPEQTENYVNTIRKLKEEYKGDIEIFLGYEVEYYPRHFNQCLKIIDEFGYDYLILGQHHINNEYDGPWAGFFQTDKEVLKTYVSQVIEAMKTEKFSYVAHPDLINFVGDEDFFKEQMREICVCAKDLDMPLEFNFLGLADKRNYPRKSFFEVVAECGNDVIFGIDAHRLISVTDCQGNDGVARKMLNELGVKNITDKIKLANGKTV